MDPIRSKGNLSQILSHPLRLTIYELIWEGAKTAPELAEIMNINRINLYHHLKQMESNGLISSSYNEDRTKKYSISDKTPNQKIQIKSKTITQLSLVIHEPKLKDEKLKFNTYLRELCEDQGESIPADHSVIQIHIFTQAQSVSNEIQEKLSQVKIKRSKSK